MTTAQKGGEWSALRPGRPLPPGKTRYPLNRRLGGPQGRSGQVRKILPPPGFDPRTVQFVVSRYTVWATRPVMLEVVLPKMFEFLCGFQYSISSLRNPAFILKAKRWCHFEQT
jgi:hypothetical protein